MLSLSTPFCCRAAISLSICLTKFSSVVWLIFLCQARKYSLRCFVVLLLLLHFFHWLYYLFFGPALILGLRTRTIVIVLIVVMVKMAILLVVACSCVVWTAIDTITTAEMLAIVIVERWSVVLSSSIGASRLVVVHVVTYFY